MTAAGLIHAAGRLIAVLPSGETLNAEEQADGLEALNLILASWNAMQTPCHSITLQSVALTGAAASYALSTRMSRILSAAVTASNITKPVEVVDANGWTGVMDKSRTGTFIETLYYDAGYPTGTVYVSPKPSSGTLELYGYTPLTAIASLATTIALPPGYERALKYALAVDIAPEYGRSVPPEVAAVAAEAMAALATLNAQTLGAAVPPAAPPVQG